MLMYWRCNLRSVESSFASRSAFSSERILVTSSSFAGSWSATVAWMGSLASQAYHEPLPVFGENMAVVQGKIVVRRL
jgi:hypothetical protein